MVGVFLVVADVLDHVGVGEKLKLHGKRPCLGLGLGIVDGDLDIHPAEVDAAKPLRDAQCARRGPARVIEPDSVVEPRRFHHENVSIPSPHGVAQPRRVLVRR